MELRKLKSFLVVAQELHFGRAAKKLNITQPTLTHQIQQLESELGFELFDKGKRVNKRKVELTIAGAYLTKEISHAIDFLDRVLKNAEMKSEKSKQLRLGTSKMCLTNEVIDVLRNLQLKFPDITFKIEEYSTAISVQEALFKENIDIGITTLPVVFKGINYQVLQNKSLNVIMPKNHPLVKYQKIKIEQLRNDKWIELTKDLYPAIMDDVEVYCRNVGFSKDANTVQVVSNVELLVGLVSIGIGIAIFPSYFPTKIAGIVSKELVFYDNTRLEITKILAFKETLDGDYLSTLQKMTTGLMFH